MLLVSLYLSCRARQRVALLSESWSLCANEIIQVILSLYWDYGYNRISCDRTSIVFALSESCLHEIYSKWELLIVVFYLWSATLEHIRISVKFVMIPLLIIFGCAYWASLPIPFKRLYAHNFFVLLPHQLPRFSYYWDYRFKMAMEFRGNARNRFWHFAHENLSTLFARARLSTEILSFWCLIVPDYIIN